MSFLRRKGPRILTVKEAYYLTPSVIRVTFSGPQLVGLPAGRDGGNCKLTLPSAGQTLDSFVQEIKDGVKHPVRTYTVRAFREDELEMDIDFVAHGTSGPASSWALSATTGSFCGFMGPSPSKVSTFNADWYFVAADLSALPMAAATLESMPRDAKGVAVFEVTSPEDRQSIDAPAGVEIHWLTHDNPMMPSVQQEQFVRELDWPANRVQVCVAGETSIVKRLRKYLLTEKNVSKGDAYISGYWKIGLVEEEHQRLKKKEAIMPF